MRLLFTFVGGRGHFEPLAPIARAAVAAGHTVAFASGGLHEVVEAAGFRAFRVEPPRAAPRRRPLQGVDDQRERALLRDVLFGSAARARVPSVIEVGKEWRPDVLVCDEADLGSMVAAERLGRQYAVVIENASGGLIRPEEVAPALAALRRAHGVAPAAPLVLSPFPPGLRDPAYPLPPGAVSLRVELEAGPAPDGCCRCEGRCCSRSAAYSTSRPATSSCA